MKTQFTTPLHTDLYQLTMANAYFHAGIAEREATFNLYYRSPPKGVDAVVFAGLEQALEWLAALSCAQDELAFIRQSVPNLHPAFVEAMCNINMHVNKLVIRAFDEGTIVYPNTPMLTVTGPQWLGQLIETGLLNEINHQTLIATTAAHICEAANGDPVLEFGFRRAHGSSAALHGARAAIIGGAVGTSNVLAGKLYNVPIAGTHAHSWIMSFPSEHEAFVAYASVYPNDCVFLVDTYDTIQGTRSAICVAKKLGIYPKGVRLDSGDLCALSKVVRRLLDEAGFYDTTIIASNDLDAPTIKALKQSGAMITAWGVGTRLITAFAEPALGGVYKLSSYVEGKKRVNVSKNTPGKTSLPGQLTVWRYYDNNHEPVYDRVCVNNVAPKQSSTTSCVEMLHLVFKAGIRHRPTMIPVARAKVRKSFAACCHKKVDVIIDDSVKESVF